MPVRDVPRFGDYLENHEVYDRLEQYFLDYFMADILASGLRVEDFHAPHYNTFFVDGTKDRDANPIFSARHVSSGDVLRVVIFDSHPEYTEVHNRIGDSDGQDELCLFIALVDLPRAMGAAVAWAVKRAE